MSQSENGKFQMNWAVFVPSLGLILLAVVIGLVDNKLMVDVSKSIFNFTLLKFGWLYQLLALSCLSITIFVFFSKFGKIKIGGKNAKPNFNFLTTFAMALTGGIATGVVTYSVNEPIIYLGNIYGEIANQGFAPMGREASVFALARCFYNWTFFPYAMYSVVGLMIAYMHFNKGQTFSLVSAIRPVIGRWADNKIVISIIDIISLLSIALGLASGLGEGLTLLSSGLQTVYGIHTNHAVLQIIAVIIVGTFITSSMTGFKRGVKTLASTNAFLFYALAILIFIVGPTDYIMNLSTTAIGYWLNHFFGWSLDAKNMGGEALVTWWTMFDWAIWIAYAPLMGLFLAKISYGRTIKEFLIINWILPAVFGLLWFGIWGATAIDWQLHDGVNLVQMIKDNGAFAALWLFLKHFPFSSVLIPIVFIVFILSYATAADSLSSIIASVCVKQSHSDHTKGDDSSPKFLRAIWGILIGVIAYTMVVYGAGKQGIEGIKYLASAASALVLIYFILVVIAAYKVFAKNSDNSSSTYSKDQTIVS